MEVLTFNNVIDIGDVVYLYSNKNRVFTINPKKSLSYKSSDPFVVVETYYECSSDEDPDGEKYCKIKDLKTGMTFDMPFSHVSLEPDDTFYFWSWKNIEQLKRIAFMAFIVLVFVCTYVFGQQ